MLTFDNPWKVVVLVGALAVLRAGFTFWRSKSALRRNIVELLDSGLIAFVLVFFLIRPLVVQAFYIPSESMFPTFTDEDRILVNKFIYHINPVRRQEVIVFKAPRQATGGENKDFIKRLIGLPGDLIQVKRGRILVDEQELGRMEVAMDLGFFGDEPVKLLPAGIRIGEKYFSIQQIADKLGAPASQIKIIPGVVLCNGEPLEEPYIAEDPDYDYPADMFGLPTGQPHQVPPGRVFVMGDNRNDSNDSHRWGDLARERVLGKAMVTFWPPTRVKLIH